MSIRHQVRLYNTAGQLQATFDQWRSLQVQLKINTFSECVFEIDKTLDNRWQLFTTDSFVQVLRSDAQYGIPWTQEYLGFHRSPKHSLTEAGNNIFTSYGRSLEDLLSRRSVAYQTGTGSSVILPGIYVGFTHKLGPADDIMKAFVRQNVGSDANNLIRLRPGKIANFLVDDDHSLGAVWEGDRSYKVIREVCTEIAEAAGVDYSVQLVSFNPPTFIFMTHFPIRGIDRSQTNPPVILSPDFQNVKTVDYTVSRTDEANVAIVLGTVTVFVPAPDPALPGTLIPDRIVRIDTLSGGVQSLTQTQGTIIPVLVPITANGQPAQAPVIPPSGQLPTGEVEKQIVYTSVAFGSTDSPWNDIELIRDVRSEGTQQALLNAANDIFATLGPKESFIVTPLVGSNVQYGRDYFFGDRILVKFGNTVRVKKVVGVSMTSSDQGGEQLTIELGDISPTPGLLDAFRNLSNRISSIEHKGDL